ncbi:MAG: hypothetical protein NZ899_05380 [Thermoguttaceae bacterium]|nr:hypothetical protein [Thermoguttaceae bacterium]MDW8078253.1 hypothetical protein [Thermoguttaceae bacterium]
MVVVLTVTGDSIREAEASLRVIDRLVEIPLANTHWFWPRAFCAWLQFRLPEGRPSGQGRLEGMSIRLGRLATELQTYGSLEGSLVRRARISEG